MGSRAPAVLKLCFMLPQANDADDAAGISGTNR
jgi:hypothetical protein